MALDPPKKLEEWTKYGNKQIDHMHSRLTVLYDGIEDPEISASVDKISKEGTVLEDESLLSSAQTFSQHCQRLGVLLSTPTSGPVKLHMNSVINVLARCLKVSSADVKSRPSMSELSELLPGLHQNALLALTQLILCCGSNVLIQSRTIVDLCLHTLSGSKHTNLQVKSITRACVYQVLCLLVGKFGWGRYLQSQAKALIQELVADIIIQENTESNAAHSKQDSQADATYAKQEVEGIAQRKGKKRKKGKKHKGDSYSDLSVLTTKSPEAVKCVNKRATVGALQLSCLIIEKAEFSEVETLIKIIQETCKTLQREGCPALCAFTAADSRLALYDAVFSSAAVRLGPRSNRKVTINHFQVINMALTLINRASQQDSSPEIQAHCQRLIVLMRNSSNSKPPVVRKILPEEATETRDVLEVERESERLSEENKRLWSQLVDAQLQVERQQREMEDLRQRAVSDEKKSSESNEGTTEKKDINGNISEEEDTPNMETEESKDFDKPEDDNPEVTLKNLTKEKVNFSISSPDKNSQAVDKDVGQQVNDGKPLSKSAKKKKKKRMLDDKPMEPEERKKAKVATPTKSVEVNSSPAKQQHLPSEENNLTEDVAAMISDFVDADPDQS